MKLTTGLVCSFFLAVVFAFLVRVEPELAYASRPESRTILHAFHAAERLPLETSQYYQLYDLFARFREMIFENSEAMFEPGHRSAFIQSEFIGHDLVMSESNASGSILKYKELTGSMDEEFIRIMVKVLMEYALTNDQEVFSGEKDPELFARANKLLHKIIGNSGETLSILASKGTRLSTYEGLETKTGLYWDSLQLPNGNHIHFFCRLNLHDYDEEHTISKVLQKYNSPDRFCLYYDSKTREFRGTRFLERDFSASLKKQIKSHLLTNSNRGALADSVNLALIKSGDEFAIIGRPLSDSGLTPIVVSKVDPRKRFSIADEKLVGFYIIICLGIFIFIQTVVFDRGLRLSVGRMLILSCLLAISMPFLMGRAVFRLILQETLQNESMKLETELHNAVSSVDSGVRLFHANLYQNFMTKMGQKETIKKFQEFQNHQEELKKQGTLEESEVDPTGAAELIVSISDEAFAAFEKDFFKGEYRPRRSNAVLILGPYGFRRFFDRFSINVAGHRQANDNNSLIVLLNLYMRTIEPFFPPRLLAKGLANHEQFSGQGAGMSHLQKVVDEEIKSGIIGAFGIEKFFEIFANFDGMNQMRTSVGILHFSVFPMYLNGIIEFFGGVAWDESTVSEIYLKNVFNNLKLLNEENKKKTPDTQKSIFTYLDPAYYFEKNPVFLQGFSGIRGNNVYSGDSESPKLGSFFRASARNKKPVKHLSQGADSAIYKVLPGRFFTLYTIGARQSRTHLEETSYWRTVIFFLGLIIFILLAIVAAFNISRSFTGPLDHLLWGLGMIARNDYSVRLKDSREDEFGSISRAFNFMTKRLREKDTLGKFVSESVRRIASDQQLLEKAQRGSETEVTILFADLEGFLEFTGSADQFEIQRKLEFILEKFFMLAEEAGGEVDKVMGEKLLIIFPHARSGKKKAAEAATMLAKKMTALMKNDKHLRPVFGINSGRVIEGIIGTPSVRMDNTVIGDPVNVAARLCSLADGKDMPIIISGQIRELLGKNHKTQRIEIERIRGKKQEVEVFKLLS